VVLVAFARRLAALTEQMRRRDDTCPVAAVRIQTRHHFASSLQRMSVVCNVTANARVAAHQQQQQQQTQQQQRRGKGDDAGGPGVAAPAAPASADELEVFDGQFVLVKGSPEAVGRLLVDGGKPSWCVRACVGARCSPLRTLHPPWFRKAPLPRAIAGGAGAGDGCCCCGCRCAGVQVRVQVCAGAGDRTGAGAAGAGAGVQVLLVRVRVQVCG
jgi:hypothetical protein